METKISKWGNSIGVRLPKKIADELGLQDGTVVDVEQSNGTIIIAPKEKTKFTIDDLIVGMTEEGVMEQYDSYDVIGKEIID